MGRGNEHLVRDALCTSRVDRQTYCGKDVDVVSVPGHESPVSESHGRKWAAAREDGAALRPTVGLFRRALGVRGRIRVGEDDRALVDSAHRLDHALIEGL